MSIHIKVATGNLKVIRIKLHKTLVVCRTHLEAADRGGDVAEIHILGVAGELGAIDADNARRPVRRQRQVGTTAHGGVRTAHGRHILNL